MTMLQALCYIIVLTGGRVLFLRAIHVGLFVCGSVTQNGPTYFRYRPKYSSAAPLLPNYIL